MSLRHLFLEIARQHPDWEVYCSTLTPTGLAVARETLAATSIFYAPVDIPPVVNKFFRALRPDLFVLVESEFWPNLLRAARKRARAVLLINGRISSRSFRKYHRIRRLAGRVLNQLDKFLVQTEADRQRLIHLGVVEEKIGVVGNLKSDVRLPAFTPEQELALKRRIGLPAENRVIVAGSTHPGEEELLLKSFGDAREKKKNLSLVLAPRHIDRAAELERLVQGSGLKAGRRSEASAEKPWDVLILDTMGELSSFYALADIAFIGGSLVPRGGQNLLEPAFYGKPILFGPHMDNFAFLADEFLRHGAARRVSRREELVAAFLGEDEASLLEMGKRARTVLLSLQGATGKTLREIESFMSKGSTSNFLGAM